MPPLEQEKWFQSDLFCPNRGLDIGVHFTFSPIFNAIWDSLYEKDRGAEQITKTVCYQCQS
jgi:hypothetical protein